VANWWEVDSVSNVGVPATARGIAYSRHSAQDRQENSIPIQQDQVREWAREHGLEIIREFADHGRSGLTAEGRRAFTDMMENWVKVRHDIQYILCFDVSRYRRFQHIDLSAQFNCHGIETFFTPGLLAAIKEGLFVPQCFHNGQCCNLERRDDPCNHAYER
jgi:hypothetical protein